MCNRLDGSKREPYADSSTNGRAGRTSTRGRSTGTLGVGDEQTRMLTLIRWHKRRWIRLLEKVFSLARKERRGGRADVVEPGQAVMHLVGQCAVPKCLGDHNYFLEGGSHPLAAGLCVPGCTGVWKEPMGCRDELFKTGRLSLALGPKSMCLGRLIRWNSLRCRTWGSDHRGCSGTHSLYGAVGMTEPWIQYRPCLCRGLLPCKALQNTSA